MEEKKKVMCRITDNGVIGGFQSEIFHGGKWIKVPNLVTDGSGSSFFAAFENKTQAMRAAKKYARWLA